MKAKFIFLFILVSSFAKAQTASETEQKYMDTLKMNGVYLIGKNMPDFKINLNQDRTLTNKDLAHKVTFIHFWFEACAPCLTEMKALEELYQDFKANDKFQFWSITYDEKSAVNKTVKQYNLSFPVASESFETCNLLNFGKGYPTTIIIDENSKIIFFNSGGSTDSIVVESYYKGHVYPLLNCLLKCR